MRDWSEAAAEMTAGQMIGNVNSEQLAKEADFAFRSAIRNERRSQRERGDFEAMRRSRIWIAAVGPVVLAALASGCGSSDEGPADAHKMPFQLTDAGCAPHDAKAPAGPIAFEVETRAARR